MPSMSEEWEDLEGPGSMAPYRTVVCNLTIPDEPDPLTTFIIAALAMAFAAFCVWLTVRIVNRRERWAKWTAVVVVLPVLYVASFGPACYISHRYLPVHPWFCRLYWPVGWVAVNSPEPINAAIRRYAMIGYT